MTKKKIARTEEPESFGKSVLQVLGMTAVILVIWYFVFSLVLSNDRVFGPSMQPTFEKDDRLISIRQFTPARNDIVVLKAPDAPNALYIKRIVGLPGDRIVAKNDRMYINGKLYPEPYLNNHFKQADRATGKNYTFNFKVTVPKGYYWVMGDHRDISNDSRYFGPVKRSSLLSQVKLRYWPITQIAFF